MIKIFPADALDFSTNGLTILDKCINPQIVEELNGDYSFKMDYPIEDKQEIKSIIPASTSTEVLDTLIVGTQGTANLLPKSNYIQKDNIILANDQPFRIYYTERDMNYIYISARHIFYDLLDNFLEDARPTNLSGAAALDWILTHTQYAHPFTSIGDVGGSNTKYFVRKNPVAAIMGDDGIIANWGGELKRDKFSIGLYNAIGLDRGVLVSYGKNIQGIKETLDTSGIVTRIMPVGKDGLLLTEKYVDSPYINNYPHPKIAAIEFSDIESEAELRTAATNYFTETQCDIPLANYKIDFLELSKTEEYKNYAVLERVYLGDTVTIKHSKLNINLKAKAINTTKNVLTGRLEKIELGSFKPNSASNADKEIQSRKKEIEQVTSAYQEAIENATNLITGSSGGNVVIRRDEAGKPYEILIMDTTDVMTAKKVWRWNIGGFGYSSTGINGPFETAITMDGSIVGSFITALEITGGQITAGIIKSKSGKWQFNLDGETIDLGGKLIYDGANLNLDADSVKIAVGQIGGNNLLKNSGFEMASINAISGSSIGVSHYYFTGAMYGVNAFDGDLCLYFDNFDVTYPSDSYLHTSMGANLKAGKTYTFSYYAAHGGSVTGCSTYLTTDGYAQIINVNSASYIVDENWHRYKCTFTCSADGYYNVRFGFLASNQGWMMVDDVQLEEGENATAWSSNANELKSNIVEITDDHLRATFQDGSYSEMVKEGFHHVSANGIYEYHYLSYTGNVGIGYIYNGTNTLFSVNLPTEFKNKTISASIAISTCSGEILPSFIKSFYCKINSIDNVNLKLNGECIARAYSQGADGLVNDTCGVSITLSYTVFA